jgi:hypothetical protein
MKFNLLQSVEHKDYETKNSEHETRVRKNGRTFRQSEKYVEDLFSKHYSAGLQ